MFNKARISLGLAIVGCVALGSTSKILANPSMIKDGTYLYGESSKPNQIGKDYIIFTVKDAKVKGSVYRPNSEFYCFSGKVDGEQLKLSFKDPESGTIYNHEIGLRYVNNSLASVNKLPVDKISLNGFEPIAKLSEVDYQILKACSK